MNSKTGAAPLAGIRVLDLSRILAGPFATQALADLGADVIKIEAPEGDATRGWGPPFVKNADGTAGDAAYFHAANRGKRSVTADLESDEGRALVRRLAAKADVLVENFKAGGLAGLGLDPQGLMADNPRLIVCSVTGFGQDGPRAGEAGYDFMIQGLSGIMDITGEPGRPGQKMGVAFADIFTGLYAVIAIEAALYERERSGHGQWIDMALFDSMLGVLANQAMNALVSGESPQRLGNAHPNIVPYQTFRCADGEVIVTVGTERQFRALLAALDLEGLAGEPRFATNRARVDNRQALIAHLEPAFRGRTREAILEACRKAHIPAGPINTVGEALCDPQALHRAMVSDFAVRDAAAPVPGLRTPIRFSRSALALKRASPRLGEHDEPVRNRDGWPEWE